MKSLAVLLLAGSLIGGGVAQAQTADTTNTQQGAKDDMKDAAHATGHAAKKTGSAVKKTTKKGVHAGKKGVNKAAHATKKGADKVEDKTDDNPNN